MNGGIARTDQTTEGAAEVVARAKMGKVVFYLGMIRVLKPPLGGYVVVMGGCG